MKLTKLTLAVAATLVAGQAFAAPVTQANVVSARTAGTLQEVWLSGASAPTFNVFDSFARGCDANSVSIFTSNTAAGKPGSIGDYNAYACTRAGAVTVAYHTVAGGSFNAYAPHLPASLGLAPDNSAFPAVLQRVKNVGTATCSGSGVYTPTNSPSYLTGGATTIPVSFSCNRGTAAALADSAPALPHGGFSDVEAKLWGYDIQAYGTESATNVQQAFGIVVTTNLYRALQVAQGIYADVAAANTADSAFSPANAPNITSAQYAAIVQNGGGYQTDWSPILGTAGAGKNINLVRRTGTSGTQASSNAFFLNNPCASGAPAGQTSPAAIAQATATFTVSEQSGTSGVKTALTTINSHATQNFGLGVVSLENTSATAYKFVKIDGVHPEAGDTTNARATMVNGSYKFVMEMNTFVSTSAAGSYAETLINEIATGLSNPATCTDVGRGMALSPVGGSACEVGTYVSKGTKFGNNCAPMQLFY
jgi:hypothetical protein